MSKSIGLALGGGGARGLAHVGVLRALRSSEETRPTLIAGTSAGSIFGTLYAAGVSQPDIEKEARNFDWFDDVINVGDSLRRLFEGQGLISNGRLGENIAEMTRGASFDDLPVELAITASDLENKRRVVFVSSRMGKKLDRSRLEALIPPPSTEKPGCETVIIAGHDDVGLAVRASCAVPGVFQPVEIDGMRLVDGGVLDQVPVDVLQAMGADVTVGVALGLPFYPTKFVGLQSVHAATVALSGIHPLRRNLDEADIGFQIEDIDSTSIVEAHQPELIEMGQRSMEKRKEELERLIKKGRGLFFWRRD